MSTGATRRPVCGGSVCMLAASLALAAPAAAKPGAAATLLADARAPSLPPHERRYDAPTDHDAAGPSDANRDTPLDESAGVQRLDELNLLSDALIGKAASGSAPAHAFRIEARMYRELLRQTMLADRERPLDQQLPQPLLLDMVRMSALLHAAADCKTGLVITCPADLMLQLRSQQARVSQGLRLLKLTYE